MPNFDTLLAETLPPDEVPARPTDSQMSISIEPEPNTAADQLLVAGIYRMVGLALRLLEYDKSVQTLVTIGATAVERWGDRKNPRRIVYPTKSSDDQNHQNKMPSDDEMREWVKLFLRKVRNRFPHVNVRNLDDSTWATFERADWEGKARERCMLKREEPNPANLMRHWEPRDAGTMTLDLVVSA